MLKKRQFYLSLIIIYILFLMKDNILKPLNNLDNLKNVYEENKENYYKEEYTKISTILNIEPLDYHITYSKVIIRNIYDFFNKVTINKGLEDNIKKGDIVITENGVLGLISKVYNNYSEIELLTNKNTNLSVKINESYGILTSHDNKLIVKNIKLNNELKEGDKVYTSGLTSVPENLLIGTIKNINKDTLELEYLIEITPSINFYQLNYVGVISL